MKKKLLVSAVLLGVFTFLFLSCSTPVGITSWKNPQENNQISTIAVIALFDKLTYIKPFEEQLAGYFNSQNLKSIKSLDFLAPFQQYSNADLKKKLDSLNTDGLLLITYKGTDVSIDINSGYYGGYYGRWGGVGGGWSTTSTVNLRAKLYDTRHDVLLWSGDLTLTDPTDVNAEGLQVARAIFADWLKNNLLKNPPPPKQN